jgi:hypothetical protein
LLGGIGRYSRLYNLFRRKVYGKNSSCRTHIDTLATHLALVTIDVREVVGNGNSVKLALLGTLATTDTCHLAGFASHTALLFVHAGYIHAAPLGSFLAYLDDVARAST